MNESKKKIIIRLVCFSLISIVFSTGIFTNYSSCLVVQAEESSQPDDGDLVSAIMNIIATVLKFIFPKEAGAIEVINRLGQNGITIADYYVNNGDGTYTIDAELIQAVNEIICKDYINGQVEPDERGYYVYGSNSFELVISSKNNPSSTHTCDYSDNGCSYKKPVVFCASNNLATQTLEIGFYTLDYNGVFCTASGANLYVSGEQGLSNQSGNASLTGGFCTSTGDNGWNVDKLVYSVSVPAFDNLTTAENALRSGDYYNALNIRKNLFEVSSRFTGLPYTGGDITISATKLDGIESKLDELNATEKSTDEKVEEIVNWLYDSGDSSDESDGTVSGGNSSGDSVSGGDSSGGSSGGGLSAFLDGLGAIGDAILYILGKLLEYIGKAVELMTNTITKVIEIIPKNFTNLLTALFPFIPTEMLIPVELMMVLAVILIVIKAFR